MSPRPADPAVRTALLESAARIVGEEGRASLTLRRLAREVGTSTMAVYTHFGSMEELRREVRREGFSRLGARLEQVGETGDPVADTLLLGAAYRESALSEPNLYRAMFMDGPVDEEDAGTGLDTFMYLVKGLARCVDAKRLPKARGVDPAELAVELWALDHGLVSLHLAGLLPQSQVVEHLESAGRGLFLSWGDDPAALRRSRRRAVQRLGSGSASSSTSAARLPS